jgi:shikimate dehydrogenase
LHTAAYATLGLRGWSYVARECPEARLLDTLQELEAAGLAGVSLTMPLKRAVIPMLARVDRLAADVGAANTVLFGGVTGDWWGANTDVTGMVSALADAGMDSLLGQDAPWVLGTGATASSALAALAQLGAREVVVVARHPANAGPLLEVAARFGLGVVVKDWSAAGESVTAPLVMSTTPAGSTDGLADAARRVRGVLFDVVYAPWPTRFAAAWLEAGGMTVGGLNLLVHQAAQQVRLMTGRDPAIDKMKAVGQAILAIKDQGPVSRLPDAGLSS